MSNVTLNYLSNLFTKFKFKNAKAPGKDIIAETQEHFDTLEISGDEWISFAGEGNATTVVSDDTTEVSKSIKIQHAAPNKEDPDAVVDKCGNKYDAKGHFIGASEGQEGPQFAVLDDDREGNLTFTVASNLQEKE